MRSYCSPFGCMAMVATAAVASGCDGEGGEAVRFEVRDSAGIEIVESPAPALGEAAAWTIDSVPIMRIGAVEAAEPYVLTRVWDATRLADGRVVLVDELTLEIRVFDSTGEHLITFGGAGEGPQEFGGPPFVEAVDENTFVAWDGGRLRLSWFQSDGRLLDQVSLQPQLAELEVVAFRNGRVWEIDAEGRLLSTGPVRPRPSEGLRDSYRRIAVVEDRGAAAYELGTFLSGQSYMVRLDRMTIGIGNPYAPNSAAALAAGGRVAIGSGSSWEIRVIDPPGTVIRIMRAAIPQMPVTAELEEMGLARAREMAERSPLSLGQAEDAFAQIPLPDSVPIVGEIESVGGTLWVGRRTGSWWEIGDYDVFDADGRWLTTVTMPADVETIHEIGHDYILAHVTDDLDVSYLHVYRIGRGG